MFEAQNAGYNSTPLWSSTPKGVNQDKQWEAKGRAHRRTGAFLPAYKDGITTRKFKIKGCNLIKQIITALIFEKKYKNKCIHIVALKCRLQTH